MNDKLKVIHLIDSTIFGGAERYIIDLARKLKSKEDLEVEVVSLRHNQFLFDACQTYDLNYSSLCKDNCSTRVVMKKLRALNSNGKVIYHTHGYKTNFLTRLSLLFRKARVFTTVHSTLDYWKNPFKRFIYSNLDRLTSFKNEKIIVVSEYIKDYYSNFLNRNKIVTIYNGVDETIFKPKQKEMVLPITILNVGNLNEVKNHITLLKAAEQLKNKYQIKVQILGEGNMREELESYIHKNDLSDIVTLMGFVEDVAPIYQDSNLYISTSTEESFGLSIIEAMLSSLPVVSSKVGGVKEIIKDYETGLFYDDPLDGDELIMKIEEVLNSSELYNKLKTQGYEHALNNFSLTQVVEEIYKLYKVDYF